MSSFFWGPDFPPKKTTNKKSPLNSIWHQQRFTKGVGVNGPTSKLHRNRMEPKTWLTNCRRKLRRGVGRFHWEDHWVASFLPYPIRVWCFLFVFFSCFRGFQGFFLFGGIGFKVSGWRNHSFFLATKKWGYLEVEHRIWWFLRIQRLIPLKLLWRCTQIDGLFHGPVRRANLWMP